MATSTINDKFGVTQITALLATAIGIAVLLIYPLHEPVTGGANNIPGPTESIFVLPSLFLGPILVTIGVFVFRHQRIKSLTPRRALLAPILCVCALLAGLGRYAYAWKNATPSDGVNSNQIVDPSIIEIIDIEVGVGHITSVAAMAAFVAGTITAQNGRKAGILCLLFAITLLTFAVIPLIIVSERKFSPSLVGIIISTIITSIPFLIGYYATKQT